MPQDDDDEQQKHELGDVVQSVGVSAMDRYVGLASCGTCRYRESREAGTEEVALRLAMDSLIKHQSEDGCPNEGSRVSSKLADPIH